MIIHGRNILIYQDGVAIAAAKSCEIHVGCEKIPIASPDTGDWEDNIAGRKNWTVRMNTLVVSVYDHLMNIGSRVKLTFGVVDKYGELSADRLTGYAICDDATITGNVGNLATGSFVFDGCGEMSRAHFMSVLRDSQQLNLRDVNDKQLMVLDELEDNT